MDRLARRGRLQDLLARGVGARLAARDARWQRDRLRLPARVDRRPGVGRRRSRCSGSRKYGERIPAGAADVLIYRYSFEKPLRVLVIVNVPSSRAETLDQ